VQGFQGPALSALILVRIKLLLFWFSSWYGKYTASKTVSPNCLGKFPLGGFLSIVLKMEDSELMN
jgi:hypothetical protein